MTTTAILTTTPAAIAGFLSIVPAKDVRYYLSGVYVEPDTGILIACDGHVMLGHRTKARVSNVSPFIIPATLLENVIKMKCAQVRISIETDAPGIRIITLETGCGEGKGTSFEPDGRTFTMQEIAGTYPDWRRIVPRTVSGVAAQLDPYKLVQVRDAMASVRGLTRKQALTAVPHVCHNGEDGPAVLTCSDLHTFAIIQPWRTEGSDLELTLRRFGLEPPSAPPTEVPADVAQAA